MKVLNFGSLNLDRVYQLSHLVRAGETLSSTSYKCHVGGKGLNQSIALANAGVEVYHAGIIGNDGGQLCSFLERYHVNTQYIHVIDAPTGHAIIQVDSQGNNSIILHGGANQCVTPDMIRTVLSNFSRGDYLFLQNEINNIGIIIEVAKSIGMIVVLNPSPIAENLKAINPNSIDWLILNEVEGEALSGEKDLECMPRLLLKHYPRAKIVLTLGCNGAIYIDKEQFIRQRAYPVTPVDTTAAGDAFTGFFFASIIQGLDIIEALRCAAKASAIAITRAGAAESIPTMDEVASFQ